MSGVILFPGRPRVGDSAEGGTGKVIPLRERLLRQRELADLFGVSERTVQRWQKQWPDMPVLRFKRTGVPRYPEDQCKTFLLKKIPGKGSEV